MEIGPILRALAHSKTRFVLIALEVALTLAVVVNCIHMISGIYQDITRPTGLDEDLIFSASSISYEKEFTDDEDFAAAQWRTDLELIRSLPGVQQVAMTGYAPLDGNINSSSVRVHQPEDIHGSEDSEISLVFYSVGENIVDAYDVEILSGRDFIADDFLADQGQNSYDANVLITQATADYFYPEGDAVGKALGGNEEGESLFTIVGVLDELSNPVLSDNRAQRALLLPTQLCRGRFCQFVVRSSPEAAATLPVLIEEALLERSNARRVQVESTAEMRLSIFSFSHLLIKALVGVMVLLIFVTTLGIVGVTSFSVTQRQRQIGTRRALGARRSDIVRYFLVENFLVTSAGLALGVFLTYGLSFLLANLLADTSTARLDGQLVIAGMLVLWIVGLGAALAPALRGARVPPVVATRCV